MPLSLGSHIELLPVPEQTRAEIARLVEQYEKHRDQYERRGYKETPLRQDFLNPFFAALGWDMDNRLGHAEPYREVVHEDRLRVGGAMKAPDYCFRYGGVSKFFVEAKSPSTNVKGDPAPAYQLRRYGWSAHLPLSVLTDFEEFAVYDCRKKPSPDDTPAHARIAYLTFEEYLDELPRIYSLFSYEAIPKGVFDRWAESAKGKRGTDTVDAAFLKEIEGWRDTLARNIALRNDVSVDQLNFAVQSLIDRLLFLRIAEDRGVERYGRLQEIAEQDDFYRRLCGLFAQADDKYNSGLFDFSESGDQFTPDLAVDDKVIKPIIADLYYPQSPYEFSVIGADILGAVYEQFLGKVIRLTPSGRAKVDEKPEVKKAGGVYYTPKYIVDYIVEHTVGEATQAAGTPKKVAGLRVLDPACGSGSFLLGAYQRLLDWRLDYYSEHDPEKLSRGRQPVVVPTDAGDWRLSTAERKRILLDNIYGVDIDAQAVEVTKLNLLLKCLEGETERSIEAQQTMFHERALPNLGSNIKCGNSLIGPDYFAGRLDYDDDERRRVNPFDWDAEFPDIMEAGGFDCVIGNPPYIRIQNLREFSPEQPPHFKEHYKSASRGNYDIYVVFVEKGLGLLNPKGKLGFILPHKFFNAKYGEPLRTLITEGQHIESVVYFGDQQVFAGATTYTCLLFLAAAGADQFEYIEVPVLDEWVAAGTAVTGKICADEATANEWNFVAGEGQSLFRRLSGMPLKLGDIASIFVGLQTSADTVFVFKDCEPTNAPLTEVPSKELGRSATVESELLKPVVRSGSIGRYWACPSASVLFPYDLAATGASLIPGGRMASDFPQAWAYLRENERLLSGRERGRFRGAGWHQLYPKNLNVWEQPKIMLPYMITRLSAYLDRDDLYFVNVTTGGFGLTVNDRLEPLEYFTGLLNSKLLDWYLKRVSTTFHAGYFAANKQYLVQLPIRPIDFHDAEDVARHDQMVSLVERMMDLHKRLPEAKTPQARKPLEREIRDTDTAIDALVYELYDLTAEEIAIVEDATTAG